MEEGVFKAKLAALHPKERRQVIAFLLALEEKDNQAYQAELARRIDDKDPSHWVSLDELDRRLGTGGRQE